MAFELAEVLDTLKITDMAMQIYEMSKQTVPWRNDGYPSRLVV